MRFFHLSDLHIGLKLFNRDLREDQEYIFSEIADYAKREKPDAILIAGDIYDKAVPSAEAVELFDRFLGMLLQAAPGTELMLISGNHDSAPRLNVFRSILRREHVHMIGQPPRREDEFMERVRLEDSFGAVNFYLLPFVRPSMLTKLFKSEEALSYDDCLHRLFSREKIREEERNVLLSHQFYLPSSKKAGEIERMDSEIRTIGNIDAVKADLLERFDYAALGHIHKPMRVGSEFFRYSGSPLAFSVSEAGQEKAVILVEMEKKGEIRTERLPLHPLRELRILQGNAAELLESPTTDYVTLLLTAESEESPDIRDRLRAAFPNLLEIRRLLPEEKTRQSLPLEEESDPFSLCCAFLGDPDEEEKRILADALNSI